jgi:hypothetical protein
MQQRFCDGGYLTEQRDTLSVKTEDRIADMSVMMISTKMQ